MTGQCVTDVQQGHMDQDGSVFVGGLGRSLTPGHNSHTGLYFTAHAVCRCAKNSPGWFLSLWHTCAALPLNRVLSHIQPLKIPLVTISLRAPYVWMDFHSAHRHSQHYCQPFLLKIYNIFYQSKARGQRSIYSHKCIRNNCRRIHNQININL